MNMDEGYLIFVWHLAREAMKSTDSEVVEDSCVIPTLPEGSEVVDTGVRVRTDSVVACVRQSPASERQIPPPF
ncbi:MAG: hypothetical protein J4N79_04520, partial [Chloroflexi bacterium]|nr:hypothetical protein [Chloroflexota bacterium]